MVNVKKKVFALGFFDCIHKGHRYLLQKAKHFSVLANGELHVLTFDDNFFPMLDKEEKEVFTLSERRKILKLIGVKEVTILNENKDFLELSAQEFLQYIKDKAPVAIFAGSDYRFGKNAAGDFDMMTEFFKDSNINVYNVDLKTELGKKISSTDIRILLEEGKIKEANAFLGTKYYISGQVVKGRGIGKELGIPTANILPPKIKLLPKPGVYQTETTVSGKTYKSITNIGNRPTFNNDEYAVETLLIDFDGNLYGKTIKVTFINRIRDIQKFDSPAELVDQIKKDIKNLQ